MKNNANKQKEFFERLARQWDEEHGTPDEMERTALFAAQHLRVPGGQTILDLGCGTSRLVPSLESFIGENGTLIEMDISAEMLKFGVNRYRDQFNNILFIQADGHTLPLRDNFFDTLICFAFFPHLSDKSRAMGEFARVLKPGGRLIVAHQLNRVELNRLHGNVDGPVKHDKLPDEEGMREYFHAAGFRDVEVREKPGLYYASGCIAEN